MYQIMLVEDEMLVRESMAQNTNWDKFGFAPPHVFENGRQALEQLESVLPDVVITDICMPFVDGLELARNIYEKFPDTIVVVLTGFSEFSYAQKAIRYHVHDYLLKPVSPKEFDQLLENLSAELSRRDNRQGLYSRAVLADEVLKDHFFQGLFQSDTAQELPEATLAAGVELGGRFHAVALAALPQRPEGFEAQGHRVAQGCAPAQLRLLGDQHVMLIVSGDETAELMARTAAGARHLRAVMQEAEITAPIGIGGAYAGLDGLRQSAQEAQHALGYAFSTGETLLFDPELRKSSGSLQTDDCPTAAQIASTLQSGSGSRALELTGTLFTCMRRRRVHESECRPVLQRLQILERGRAFTGDGGAAVVKQDRRGQRLLLREREQERLEQSSAELLVPLAHVVGRDDDDGLFLRRRGSAGDRLLLRQLRALRRGDGDAVFGVRDRLDLDAAALALGQPSEILHRRFIVDQRLHAPRAAERLQRPQRLHDRQRAGLPHRIDPDHNSSSFVLLSGI